MRRLIIDDMPAPIGNFAGRNNPMLTQTAENYFESDEAFDALYPVNVRALSELHWSPLSVARAAANYLGRDDAARIIDIGAGVGKFCIAGSHYARGRFTGVEQNQNFVRIGNKAINKLGCRRVELIQGNFMQHDMSQYTGIYFYNSFHENIADATVYSGVEKSVELYELYTSHLNKQLKAMPAGTLLATYWLSVPEVPTCYRLCEAHFDDLLKFWKKED